MRRSRQMSTETKEIGDRGMSREKPLGLTRGRKPAHLAFPLPWWLMRDFGAGVKVRALTVRHAGQALSAGSPITAKLIGHRQAGVHTATLLTACERSVLRHV